MKTGIETLEDLATVGIPRLKSSQLCDQKTPQVKIAPKKTSEKIQRRNFSTLRVLGRKNSGSSLCLSLKKTLAVRAKESLSL